MEGNSTKNIDELVSDEYLDEENEESENGFVDFLLSINSSSFVPKYYKYIISIFIFGWICMITLILFGIVEKTIWRGSIQLYQHKFNNNVISSSQLILLNIDKNNTIYKLKIKDQLQNNRWSYISGNVLNHQKEYLFGFGKELYRESGKGWEEVKEEYTTNLVFKEKGLYYLNFNRKSTQPSLSKTHIDSIQLIVTKKMFSNLPFCILGFLSLIVSGVMLGIYWSYRAFDEMNEKTKSYIDLIWYLLLLVLYVYLEIFL